MKHVELRMEVRWPAETLEEAVMLVSSHFEIGAMKSEALGGGREEGRIHAMEGIIAALSCHGAEITKNVGDWAQDQIESLSTKFMASYSNVAGRSVDGLREVADRARSSIRRVAKEERSQLREIGALGEGLPSVSDYVALTAYDLGQVRDRLRDRMRLSGEVAEGVSRQDCMDQALQLMPFAVMRVSVLFVCSGLFLAPERINESISNAERKLEGYSESDFEADRDAGLDRLAQSKAERGEVGNPFGHPPRDAEIN